MPMVAGGTVLTRNRPSTQSFIRVLDSKRIMEQVATAGVHVPQQLIGEDVVTQQPHPLLQNSITNITRIISSNLFVDCNR